MKNFLLLFLFTLGFSTVLMAQIESNIEQPISINDSGLLPDSSAILDVNATDRGMLIPRMSTSAKMAIAAPVQGLMVYDTSINQLCHFADTSWICLAECVSLDMAYDCGGPGFGRVVSVDQGAVSLNGLDTFSSTLEVRSVSVFPGSSFTQFGDGSVAEFQQANFLSGISAVNITNDGMGEGLRIVTPNPMNPTSTLDLDQGGLGNGATMITSNMMNTGLTLELAQMGSGGAFLVTDQNPIDMSNAMSVFEDGFGVAGYFQSSNPMVASPTIEVLHMGVDHAGYFETVNPMDSAETVYAINQGQGDGVRGIATTIDTFIKAGVVGTGRGSARVAAALEAHDGAIRVSKTISPNTPAEVFDTVLVSWLPMDDCPSSCDGSGLGGDTHAWNSDIITINNVYIDPMRSVITHSLQVPPPFFLRSVIRGVAAGSFSLQFVVDMDFCSGSCGLPPDIPVRVHYLVVNR